MNTEQDQPDYNASAAIKVAISAGAVSGLVVYLVNGHDFTRAGIAAGFWIVMGWYLGKAIFSRDRNEET